MAMIKCKECGKEISSLAEKCPHCGAPTTGKTIEIVKHSGSVISGIGTLLIAAGICLFLLAMCAK